MSRIEDEDNDSESGILIDNQRDEDRKNKQSAAGNDGDVEMQDAMAQN